jgi:hypothetical protein
MERNAKMSTAQHSLRRRLLNTQEETSEWLYEAYLTDTGEWYGKRCPAIVFSVKRGEQYYIEWSNVRTISKYFYDMRKCGGSYMLYGTKTGDTELPVATGSLEITIPADGTLYVGVGSNSNIKHGEINAPCFDGDWIKVRKE